jgi:hypothetical protein
MRARIRESFQAGGHEVVFRIERRGRKHALIPGEPRDTLDPPGWRAVPIEESAGAPDYALRIGDPGSPLYLPEGALEALLEEGLKIAAPDGAVSAHLADAIAVRDRTWGVLERLILPTGGGEDEPSAPRRIR